VIVEKHRRKIFGRTGTETSRNARPRDLISNNLLIEFWGFVFIGKN